MFFGRTYSKTIIAQGDPLAISVPTPSSRVVTTTPPVFRPATVITTVNAPAAIPYRPPIAPVVIDPPQPLPRLTVVVTTINAPAAIPYSPPVAPVVIDVPPATSLSRLTQVIITSAPVPVVVTSTTTVAPVVIGIPPASALSSKATIIIASSPLPDVITTTAKPVVVVTQVPVQVRGLSILASAAADVYFTSGAYITSFFASVPFKGNTQVFVNAFDVPTTITADSIVVTQSSNSFKPFVKIVSNATPDVVARTTSPVIVDGTFPARIKNYVSIQTNGAVVVASTIFGSLGPTDVIGIIRITTVVAPSTRTTMVGSRSVFSRVANVVRTTITFAVTRSTSGRINTRSTTESGDSRSSGVK